MWAPGLPYVFKVGISSSPALRAAQITDELNLDCALITSKVYVVVAIPSPFSERHEKFLHRLFSPFRASMRKHAGHTEWFYTFFPNAIAGLALFALMEFNSVKTSGIIIPALAIMPYPVGAVIALIVVFLIELALMFFALVVLISLLYLLTT
jgi:hypothetical protein